MVFKKDKSRLNCKVEDNGISPFDVKIPSPKKRKTMAARKKKMSGVKVEKSPRASPSQDRN